jgi:hypothetical protein
MVAVLKKKMYELELLLLSEKYFKKYFSTFWNVFLLLVLE